jgi:hypothetical protein
VLDRRLILIARLAFTLCQVGLLVAAYEIHKHEKQVYQRLRAEGGISAMPPYTRFPGIVLTINQPALVAPTIASVLAKLAGFDLAPVYGVLGAACAGTFWFMFPTFPHRRLLAAPRSRVLRIVMHAGLSSACVVVILTGLLATWQLNRRGWQGLDWEPESLGLLIWSLVGLAVIVLAWRDLCRAGGPRGRTL